MTGLDMILSSSLIIAVILLLRKLLGKKCNPNIRYMLWLLVAIRILLPMEFVFEVEEDSFAATVIETREVTRAQVVERIVNPSFDEELLRESEERVPNEDKGIKNGYELEDGLTLATKDEIKGNSLEQVQLTKLFGIVWIVGSVSLSFYWIGLNIYSFSKIKKRRIKGVESPIPVYRVEEINGLVGVIRPKIFISAPIVQDEMRRSYVLAHELQHYRVGDHIWQFVRCLCVIVQWFNPLVWMAYFKSQEDCELACDYRVLKELQEGEHARYAETLLYILKAGKGGNQVLITAMSNDKKNMKARLEGILKKQNRKPLIGAVVAVVALVVVVTTYLTCQVRGAAAEEDISKEEKATVIEEQDVAENDEYSYMILEEYTGYLDEFEHDIYQFEQDDLDGDGLGDRIYKTMQGEDVCNYRLELGNGEKIDLGIEASTYTVPTFEFVDLTGDGKQDIIYKAEPPFTANGGFWILDFVILVAGENGYEVAQLPFYEGGDVGLSKYLHYEFELVADDMMQVRVPDYDYEVMIPYGENTPLEYYYEVGNTPSYAIGGYDDSPVSGVWSYSIDVNTTPARLVCHNPLFDKWSVCGLDVELRYEDDAFVVEEILFDENVYDSSVVEELHLSINIEEHYITNTGDPSNLYHIDENNVLWGCGRNNSGQLGIGTQDYEFHEEMVKIAENVVHVDYSQQGFMIYLTTDNRLYGVGNAGSGALQQYEEFSWDRYRAMEMDVVTNPVLLMENVTYARCGKSDVACLKDDGSVWIWGTVGCNEKEVCFAAEPKKVLENVVLVTGGQFNHAALMQDGSVWTWGYNYAGNCGVEDMNIVSEPQKVADDVNMVWTGSTKYNSEYTHIADFEGVYERQLENTIIRKQDGTYLRCGVGVGEEKVLPVYHEVIDYTLVCTHEFVPYEERYVQANIEYTIEDLFFGEWEVTKLLGFTEIQNEYTNYPNGHDIIGNRISMDADSFDSKGLEKYERYQCEVLEPTYELSEIGWEFLIYNIDEAIKEERELYEMVRDELFYDLEILGIRDGRWKYPPAVQIMISGNKQLVVLTMDGAFYLLERV